jgi:hypothetical protein
VTGRVKQFPRKPSIRKWLPPELNSTRKPLLPEGASLVAESRSQEFRPVLSDVSKRGSFYREGAVPGHTPWLWRVKKPSLDGLG